MDIINNFGIVKKKHTYLYNSFDETMSSHFRKLKGRFYKKTNHWVFPFIKEETVETNHKSNTPENEQLGISTLESKIENDCNVSIGVQTDENDNGSLQSNNSENVIMDNFSDHLSSVLETSCSSCDVESLENMEDNKIQYKFKPPTIFYHHVGDYF
jgi:hypothetical protein